MYIDEWTIVGIGIGLLLLGGVYLGAQWLSERMDMYTKGRYSFWTGFFLSACVAALLMENIHVLDLPNDGVVAPAILSTMPHYVLILPWLLMSLKDASFFHGLPDEIGHYMLMVSVVCSGFWLLAL